MKLYKLLEAKVKLWSVHVTALGNKPSSEILWVIEAPTKEEARAKIPAPHNRRAEQYWVLETDSNRLEFEKKHQLKNIERAKEQISVLEKIIR